MLSGQCFKVLSFNRMMKPNKIWFWFYAVSAVDYTNHCGLQIWPQVKAKNAHLSSVCELGAVVGSLWRDLDPTQKQEYNELYAKDKVTVTVRCSTVL